MSGNCSFVTSEAETKSVNGLNPYSIATFKVYTSPEDTQYVIPEEVNLAIPATDSTIKAGVNGTVAAPAATATNELPKEGGPGTTAGRRHDSSYTCPRASTVPRRQPSPETQRTVSVPRTSGRIPSPTLVPRPRVSGRITAL